MRFVHNLLAKYHLDDTFEAFFAVCREIRGVSNLLTTGINGQLCNYLHNSTRLNPMLEGWRIILQLKHENTFLGFGN